MSPLDTLLVGAIVALWGALLLLWRSSRADAHESSRLIFALLQRIAIYKGESPPPTSSTSQTPHLAEAKQLAVKELNGEIEALLRGYLDTVPPKGAR